MSCAIFRCCSSTGSVFCAKLLRSGSLPCLRLLAEFLHVLLMVLDHVAHIGAVELGAAHLRQLVIGLAVRRVELLLAP